MTSLKGKWCLIEDGLWIGEYIGGKVFHAKRRHAAKLFASMDEAENYWKAKFPGNLNIIFVELNR